MSSLRKKAIINHLQRRVPIKHAGINLILDNKRLRNLNSRLRKENRKLHHVILKLRQEKRNLTVELSNLKNGQDSDSNNDWVINFDNTNFDNTKKTSLIF